MSHFSCKRSLLRRGLHRFIEFIENAKPRLLELNLQGNLMGDKACEELVPPLHVPVRLDEEPMLIPQAGGCPQKRDIQPNWGPREGGAGGAKKEAARLPRRPHRARAADGAGVHHAPGAVRHASATHGVLTGLKAFCFA